MTSPMLQHLQDRYYDVRHFPILGANDTERSITFPLWNLSGQLVGYQVYRPDADKTKKNDPREGRYFTRVKDQRIGVWGLESFYDSEELFIFEGIFDASKVNDLCHVSTIAITTSTASPQLKGWLWMLRQQRPVISVGDGDPGGLKMKSLGHRFHQMPEGIDMGDSSEDDVRKIIKDLRV